MRPAEDCEHLRARGEIGDLWVGARQVADQMQLLPVPFDQERNVARHEAGGAVADEETEIMAFNMRDQDLGTRLGEVRGQVHQRSSPAGEEVGEQCRPGQQQDGAGAAIYPCQMTRLD